MSGVFQELSGAAHELAKEGVALLERKDFDSANKKFAFAIQHVSESKSLTEGERFALADIWHQRGRCEYFLRNYDAAAKYYSRGIELNQMAASYYNNRGLAYKAAARYPEALEDYTAAIARTTAEQNYVHYFNRARVYELMRRYDEAEENVKQAIECAKGCNPMPDISRFNAVLAEIGVQKANFAAAQASATPSAIDSKHIFIAPAANASAASAAVAAAAATVDGAVSSASIHGSGRARSRGRKSSLRDAESEATDLDAEAAAAAAAAGVPDTPPARPKRAKRVNDDADELAAALAAAETAEAHQHATAKRTPKKARYSNGAAPNPDAKSTPNGGAKGGRGSKRETDSTAATASGGRSRGRGRGAGTGTGRPRGGGRGAGRPRGGGGAAANKATKRGTDEDDSVDWAAREAEASELSAQVEHLVDIGAYEQALDFANQTLRLIDWSESPYYSRALCYAGLQRYQEAIQDMNKCLEFEKSAEAYSKRAEIYRRWALQSGVARKGLPPDWAQRCRADWEAATKVPLNPSQMAWELDARGQAFLHLTRFTDAADCFLKVIELGRESGEPDAGAYSNRAEALVRGGRLTEAAEDLKAASEIDPTDPGVLMWRGRIAYLSNRLTEAAALYNESRDRYTALSSAGPAAAASLNEDSNLLTGFQSELEKSKLAQSEKANPKEKSRVIVNVTSDDESVSTAPASSSSSSAATVDATQFERDRDRDRDRERERYAPSTQFPATPVPPAAASAAAFPGPRPGKSHPRTAATPSNPLPNLDILCGLTAVELFATPPLPLSQWLGLEPVFTQFSQPRSVSQVSQAAASHAASPLQATSQSASAGTALVESTQNYLVSPPPPAPVPPTAAADITAAAEAWLRSDALARAFRSYVAGGASGQTAHSSSHSLLHDFLQSYLPQLHAALPNP